MKTKEDMKKLASPIYNRIGASFFWGLLPVLAILSGGMGNPVLYMTVWAGLKAISILVYLLARGKTRRLFSKEYRTQIFSRFLNKKTNEGSSGKIFPIFYLFQSRSIFLPFQALYILLFAVSIRYVSPLVAAIIIESWTILDLIRRISKLKKSESQPEESKSSLISALFAMLAVTLVTVSSAPFASNNTSSEWSYWLGITVVIIAMAFAWQSVLRFEQSKDILKAVNKSEGNGEESEEIILKETNSVVLFLEFLSDATSALLGVFLLIFFNIFGILGSFTGSFSFNQFLVLLIGNFCVTIPGTIFSRRSEIQREDNKYESRIHNFTSLTPAFSVLFVALIFPLRDVLSNIGSDLPALHALEDILWPWLVAGLLGVMAANILTNLKKKLDTFGLSELLIFLWLGGFFVHYRDDWDWWRKLARPEDILDYYALLGLILTAFALLVSFELTRLEQRISNEKDLGFWLFSRMRDYNIADRDDPLEEYYKKTTGALQVAGEQLDHETETKFRTIIESKQHGLSISALTAINLLGGFVILLSLLSKPPEIEGISAVFIDTSAFILPIITLYMLFNLANLTKERKRFFSLKSLTNTPDPPRFENLIFSLLVFVISAIYFIFYLYKWELIFS